MVQFNKTENRSEVYQAKQGAGSHFFQRELYLSENEFVNQDADSNDSRTHERHAGEQRKLILIGGEALEIRNAEINARASEHKHNRIQEHVFT